MTGLAVVFAFVPQPGTSRSDLERVTVVQRLVVPSFQRPDRRRFIEPDVLVELLGEHRFEVMADAFGFRSVNDADGALEAWRGEIMPQLRRIAAAQRQHETWMIDVMEDLLVAFRMRGPDVHYLHRLVPVRGRGHGAVVSTEADQVGIVTPGLTRKLADIDFAAHPHLGGGRIAHVTVVRPDHGARAVAAVAQHRAKRAEHVAVAQVP